MSILLALLWYMVGTATMLVTYTKMNKGELNLSELVNSLFLGLLGPLLTVGMLLGWAISRIAKWHSKAKYKIIYRNRTAKARNILFWLDKEDK